MIPSELETEQLRRWKASDRVPFATMNADPKVMEFFPAVLSAGESDSFIERIEKHFEDQNFGLWAVESLEFEEFVGFVGLWPASFDAHFTPAVEVGWRLDHRFWGRGYAPATHLPDRGSLPAPDRRCRTTVSADDRSS